MVNQTCKPAVWVIVDDGSTDRSADIVARYARDHEFIRVLHRPKAGRRQPGSAVIRAFEAGYDLVKEQAHDYVVKLDCDLSFEPDYFAEILARCSQNPRLGIVSGVYYEPGALGEWHEIRMPDYHAAGASKVMRRDCFEAIGGFVPSRGWDTVDEIRARNLGWDTTHFPDLKMKHWKSEGSGIGVWRTSQMHGEIFYLTGGSKLFLLFKILHRIVCRPFVVGAVGLTLGYLRSILQRRQPLVSEAEARGYRELLNRRITSRLTGVTNRWRRSEVKS